MSRRRRGVHAERPGARPLITVFVVASLVAFVVGCTVPGAAPPETTEPMPDVGSGSAGRPATVVWVSIAGLTPDRYLAEEPAMPVLAAMARGGVAAERVASITPPSTYPVHATWVTGLAPDVHGIVADQRIGERGVRPSAHRHASLLRAVPLWSRVKEGEGRVLALDWPGTQGADVAGLIPDVAAQRPGQSWNELAANGATPLLADRIRAAVRAGRPGAARDAFLTSIACGAIRSSEPPALLLLRLQQAEPPLVRSGPRSKAVRAAFEGVDARLGQLIRCSGDRLAQLAFVVSGDGAFEPVHTMLRPNALLAGSGLPAGGAGGWRALVRSNGGSAFVYARSEADALEARRVLGDGARKSGAFQILGAEEMIARKGDPEAWFGLAAEPGFTFVDDVRGPFEAPARMLGAGGYLDAPGRPTAGIVLFGRGVRSGVRVPVFSVLDLGPTVGQLLDVSLAPSTGRPRVGLLRLGPRGR